MVGKLKNVTLLHSEKAGKPVFVYKTATIEIVHMPLSKVFPAQFYQLKDTVSRIGILQKALEENNIDLFQLDGYITYRTDENNTFYTLLPMVIENQVEKDGKVVPIIVDGLHRMLLAKKQKRQSVQVIKISKVNKDYPYPAYKNPNGWKDVKSMVLPPDSKDKRLWRLPVEKAYNYYRNFNSVFENVDKPKKRDYEKTYPY